MLSRYLHAVLVTVSIVPSTCAGEPGVERYEERDADKKLILSGSLRDGKLHGEVLYFEKGKVARKLTFDRGVPQHKPSLSEIRKTLAKLMEPTEDEHEEALRVLKAYRYLARVPHDDIVLDPRFTAQAEAASKICKELGRLDHNPKNPGWPEKEFTLAQKGASSSNLGQGFKKLAQSVHAWMDDSDKFNIDQLGHRRWCINPTMKKTGFGRTEEFTAMYSFDMSRIKMPVYDYVAYPPPGHVPAGFFHPRFAWSISFNPGKYVVARKGVEANLFPLDEKGKKGEALKLDFSNVDLIPFGIPNCIIFRPADIDMTPGKMYLVEINGVQTKGKGSPTVRYVVEMAGK